MVETKDIFEALIVESQSDSRSAKLLLEGKEFSRSIYHSQQAVEKALKAVCIQLELDFPKTHSLVSLLDIIESGGIAIPDEHSPFWKDCRRKILGGKIIKIVEDDPHGKKIILKNHVNNEESTVEFNDIHCALKW